jgi:SAM-dependent methyltransferase
MDGERELYSSAGCYWLNKILFAAKLVIPQPVIQRIPGLTTNEDVRLGVVLQHVKGRLLDVGCGRNRLVRRYREQGGDGIGVDVYPWEGVDHQVVNTAQLPYDDGTFETVTFVACLNHIPNREDVLRETHRLLSGSGRVLITNLPPLVSRVWHAWAFWDDDQHERGMKEGEVWGFTDEELRRMVQAAGFRVAACHKMSYGLNRLYVCEKSAAP